jgi:serine protease Do
MVTNNHVVEDSNEINVVFVDGTSCSATIKGTDPDHDLAVVSVKLSDISQETKDAIAIATLGDSTTIQLGQPAVAIGNALGYGQSVTVGYISALEREVQMTDNTMTLIQTDAAINPGNSGGALLDMNGNVIGINSAKYSDTDVEGMGYAIPISVASPIIDDLINNTTVSEDQQAYLGIAGTDVTTSYSQSFGLPTGVYVSKVNSSSPAATAGIQAGDIITKFDGNEVSTMEGLQSKLKNKRAGDTVEITLQRQQANGDFNEETVKVTLGAKSDAPTDSSSQSDSSSSNNSNSQNSNNYGFGFGY